MTAKVWLVAGAASLMAMAPSALAQSVTGPPTNLTKWDVSVPANGPAGITPEKCPRLSLDGSKIAYATTLGGYDSSYVYDDTWVMNVDGTNRIRLEMQAYFGGMDNWGALTPDGKKIVLQKTGDYQVVPTTLYMADVDPFKVTRITGMTTTNVFDGYPTFSSDGTKVAFVSKERVGGDFAQLFVMKAEPESATNAPIQLTNWADASVTQPCGTPDGKVLFIKKVSDTVQEIFRVDLKDSNGDGEGDNLTQITNLGKLISSPSQPIAGGKVYFAATGNDGKSHVFSVNADGTGLHQVTGGDFDEQSPSAAAGKLVVALLDTRNGVGNYDIHLYSLNTTAGTGTVTGKLTTSAGAPLAGASVACYDGDNGAGDTTTDANGNYSITLPAGGYTLVFATNTPTVYEVKRSVAVTVGGTTTQDAFTTPTASPRPRGTIATIKDGKPEVKWAPASGSEGYNVYRATNENGPWTKITATPLAPAAPQKYVDTAPPDLASVLYKVTSVAGGIESAFSEVSQAANNLFYNPSFEQVDGTGTPVGWQFGKWGGDGSGGTSTTHKVDGTRSAYIKTGPTERGGAFWETPLPFYPPNIKGVSMVEGMWGKFTDTNTSWPVALKQAPWEVGYGYIPWWYPNGSERGPDLGPWDTNGLTNGGGDTEWVWLWNTDDIKEWETTEATRMTVLWPNDGLSNLDSSTAFADDVTYQVKRFTTTGWVMGRIVDTKGRVPSGVKVTCGGKTITTDGSDTFIIKDVPTGVQTLTIEAPGNPIITRTIPNYGGYRLQEIVTVAAPTGLIIKGTVFYPDGKPCPAADVRLITTDANGDAGNQVAEFTTTTDATGQWSLGSDTVDVASSYTSQLVAHKAGYVSVRMEKNFGSTGISTGNDLTLTAPDVLIEIPKATTPPVIDGTVNLGTEWAGAGTFAMTRSNTNPVPSVLTNGYVKWDTDNLYFAFVCEEPTPAGIVAPTTSHDGGMWGTPPYWNGDDLTEIRIDQKNGAGVGTGYEWWQLLLNTISVTTDIEWRWKGPSMWNIGGDISGLTTACKVDVPGKKWYQEVVIPFSGITPTTTTPVVGEEWFMTLSRNRHQPDPVGEGMGVGNAIVHFVNTLSPLAKGDLDGNRLINATDAVIALRVAGGLEDLGARKPQGDVNTDNVVNILDATKILRKVNGLDSSF